ncbi:MAG: hypothetical protein KGL39_05225 [Patescibacteria group bacterium]|nr:hypothetical protein [Patescibacteria group bacterium]
MTKLVEPSDRLKQARDKLIAVVRSELADVDAAQILAVFAYTLGQIIALQDQRTMSPSMAMTIVSKNIEKGNADLIAELASHKGTAQ